MRFYNNGEDSYHGEFKAGIPDGQGTYFWADGRYYIGEWKNGVMHGYGEYHSSDGNYYIGEFLNGEMYGQGSIYDNTGTLKVSGTFENSEYVGTTAPQQSPSKFPNINYDRINEYYSIIADLNYFYDEEYEKIMDFINDPYSSDWGQNIIEQYENLADESGFYDFSGTKNIDSYTAAQAQRQRQSFLNQANAIIAENYLSVAQTQKALLDKSYNDAISEPNVNYADVLSSIYLLTSSTVFYNEVSWCPDFGYHSGWALSDKIVQPEGCIYVYNYPDQYEIVFPKYYGMLQALGFTRDTSLSHSDDNSTQVVWIKGNQLVSISLTQENPDKIYIIARTF